jgi:hypothetical protein
MFHSGERCKLFFQRRDLRAQYPLSAFDSLRNGARQWLAQAFALGLQIDERD